MNMDAQPVVVDNGSYEVKFGYAGSNNPLRALNCIAQDKNSGWHLSNRLNNIKDISCVNIRRAHELGQLVSWELETAVWDFCFYNPDEFNGFDLKDSRDHDLVLSETCMTLPELSKNSDQVIFEEYEFKSLYKAPAASFVPFLDIEKSNMKFISGKDESKSEVNTSNLLATNDDKFSYSDFNLVIDSGFDCTWVVPTIKGVPFYKALKKLDVGGRFLNGLLKETISYRHYDVTDETILINNIKEKCLFISPTSYKDSFKNRNATAVEYVLPDFQTSFIGYVKNNRNVKQIPETAQLLHLKDELFSVPESIFHPEMSKILKPGIVETILESLSIIPEVLRPLMVGNITCVGGNFNLPNFGTRISQELQRQLPTEWACNIHVAEKDNELTNWNAMSQFVSNNPELYQKARVTKQEYNEHGLDWSTKQRFGYQNWI